MNYKKTQHNKGYTLLFAVLVSSLVLAVGVSILNISKKEFLLSSSARESTTAIYVADSGIECALFYDKFDDHFQTSDGSRVWQRSPKPDMNCFNNIVAADTIGAGFVQVDPTTFTFTFDLKLSNDNSCATVKVTKSSTGTSIESRGYNIGWKAPVAGSSLPGTCDVPSPRRVERALLYSYR